MATGIECRRVSDHLDYSLTGEVFEPGGECTVERGLACHNKHQPDNRCDDYEVRFFCELQGKMYMLPCQPH